MNKKDFIYLPFISTFLVFIPCFTYFLPLYLCFAFAISLFIFASLFSFLYFYTSFKQKQSNEMKIIDYIKKFEEANERQLIVSFDFDETLCKEAYPNIGKPKKHMIELAKFLQAHHVYTILWTCRAGTHLENAKKWCEEQGLKFDKYNEHSDMMAIKYDCNTPKVYADFVFDDKCYNSLTDVFSINTFSKVIKEKGVI